MKVLVRKIVENTRVEMCCVLQYAFMKSGLILSRYLRLRTILSLIVI